MFTAMLLSGRQHTLVVGRGMRASQVKVVKVFCQLDIVLNQLVVLVLHLAQIFAQLFHFAT